MQAAENEEKRIKAEARLKAAFNANIQILEKKRQDFYARERLNEERRNKQEQDRIAADELKRLELEDKKEKRKVRSRMQENTQHARATSHFLIGPWSSGPVSGGSGPRLGCHMSHRPSWRSLQECLDSHRVADQAPRDVQIASADSAGRHASGGGCHLPTPAGLEAGQDRGRCHWL